MVWRMGFHSPRDCRREYNPIKGLGMEKQGLYMNDTQFCEKCLDYKRCIKELEKKDSERNQQNERIRHLNAILVSMRDVSRLIIKEKDRLVLIQGICRTLIERRGFHNAWIVLMDENKGVIGGAEAGLGEDFKTIITAIERGDLNRCCQMVLKSQGVMAVENPPSECRKCPVSHMYGGRGALSARLEHNGKTYGILTVSVPALFSKDDEELELFKDMADDIAHALHSMETEKERRQAEIALREARDKLEQRVRERTAELERLSTRLLNAQEEERKRIAADLHDGIGQCLSAVKFMVETALEQLGGKVGAADLKSLKALIPLLQESSQDVRNITMNLRPSILDDLGILITIKWFCRQFQAVYSHIRISEAIEVEETDVPDAIKTIIFRILQEAFNNVSKHGCADHIALYLGKQDNRLELRIEDNGCGFIAAASGTRTWEKGFGITGMKERAELSGGSFAIISTPEKGTRVQAAWDYARIRTIS
jgi:signal transduction histidine kinase